MHIHAHPRQDGTRSDSSQMLTIMMTTMVRMIIMIRNMKVRMVMMTTMVRMIMMIITMVTFMCN